MKQSLKAVAAKFGKHMAYNTVGKSYPYYFYEPKVPAALKKTESKQENMFLGQYVFGMQMTG